LRRLSRQIPTLVSAVRVQVRLIFESDLESQSSQNPDYQAICWLVNQQYLNPVQAATLIEELAEEVIVSLLSVKEGTYQLIDQDQSKELPKFCRLDLRTLVERCHEQLRRQQSTAPTSVTSAPRRDASGQNGTQSKLELIQKSAQKTSPLLQVITLKGIRRSIPENPFQKARTLLLALMIAQRF
jgi:chemotaxis family two-component system response regulator PixG